MTTVEQATLHRPILLVDDEPNIIRALGYVLTKEGFRVETASSGEEALLQARKLSPLIIFLDIMMPGISGLEVCERLRGDRTIPRAHIIMLSAKGQRVDVEHGLATGADEYMVKPFSPREVIQHVRELVARLTGA
jgi:DNA-binding response OmpR family regulator